METSGTVKCMNTKTLQRVELGGVYGAWGRVEWEGFLVRSRGQEEGKCTDAIDGGERAGAGTQMT